MHREPPNNNAGTVDLSWGRFDASWLNEKIKEEQERHPLADKWRGHEVYSLLSAKDNSGNLVGGAVVAMAYDYVSLIFIWIDEAHRRQGLGQKLVLEIEAGGQRQKKSRLILSTFAYQNATSFWTRCGLVEFGRLPGATKELELIYFSKPIGP